MISPGIFDFSSWITTPRNGFGCLYENHIRFLKTQKFCLAWFASHVLKHVLMAFALDLRRKDFVIWVHLVLRTNPTNQTPEGGILAIPRKSVYCQPYVIWELKPAVCATLLKGIYLISFKMFNGLNSLIVESSVHYIMGMTNPKI